MFDSADNTFLDDTSWADLERSALGEGIYGDLGERDDDGSGTRAAGNGGMMSAYGGYGGFPDTFTWQNDTTPFDDMSPAISANNNPMVPHENSFDTLSHARPDEAMTTPLTSAMTMSPAALAASLEPNGSLVGPAAVPAMPRRSPAPPASVPAAATELRKTSSASPTPQEVLLEGAGYVERETDPEGDEKVDILGRLSGGRKYRCRTFRLKCQGERLFNLGTEVAKVFGYRDSYLLFHKNPDLRKMIVNETDKHDMIAQNIIPYAFRSRQIGVVTARSVFRVFGARAIMDGKRIDDDYFVTRVRAQGAKQGEPVYPAALPGTVGTFAANSASGSKKGGVSGGNTGAGPNISNTAGVGPINVSRPPVHVHPKLSVHPHAQPMTKAPVGRPRKADVAAAQAAAAAAQAAAAAATTGMNMMPASMSLPSPPTYPAVHSPAMVMSGHEQAESRPQDSQLYNTMLREARARRQKRWRDHMSKPKKLLPQDSQAIYVMTATAVPYGHDMSRR